MGIENGFLYQQECEVVVVGDIPVSATEWLNVNLEEHPSHSAVEDETCFPCDLVVAASDDGSVRLCGPRPRFDGTVKDTKSTISAPGGCKQRSDAVLLLGLAVKCQDLGHIFIKTAQLRLEDNPRTSEEHSAATYRRLASMYITFQVPQVPVKSRRGRNDRYFISLSSKMLPPSTQLLLMLMRSDWDFLDAAMSNAYDDKIIRKTNKCRRKPSLFPSKLLLKEVYPRIGTAASLDLEIAQELKSRSDPGKVTLESLPRDILEHRIAVFLRARSLDSLRCSCKSVHRNLRSVVPGLKLTLYSHQVKSLGWMRYRETQSISEGDLISTVNRRVHCMDGDPHRSATGGGTTLLLDRREGAEGVHISQFDGGEVIVQDDNPLSRMVARGGLLCDDPGLGKTITVLSLLLQTFGLSTSSTHDEAKEDTIAEENKLEKTRDQRIFEEYWNENLVSRDRSSFMLSFLMDLSRANRFTFGYFELPVNPVKDGCPDYYEVIKEPLCFKLIRQKVNDGEYGMFGDFERDIEKMFEYVMLCLSLVNDVDSHLNPSYTTAGTI